MNSKWVDFRAVKQTVSLEAVLRWYQVKGLRRSGRSDHLRGGCPLPPRMWRQQRTIRRQPLPQHRWH